MAELDRVVTWALASFHTALLVLVLVLLLHNGGALGTFLGTLSTEAGALVYLALWAAVGAAARQTVRGAAFAAEGPRVDGVPGGREAPYLAAQAALYGGLVGAAVVVVAVVALFVANSPALPSSREVLSLTLFVGIGGTFAFGVGAVVGVLLSVLDALLLGAARRLLLG